MGILEKLDLGGVLGDRERRLLEVLLNHGGKARFKDFTGALEGRGMSRRTIDKGLKALVETGVLKKERERVEGRRTWVYVFQSKEVLEIFGKMERQMGENTGEIYLKIARPGLGTPERCAALRDGIVELMEFQNALTLMGIRLSLLAPDERTAAHRLTVLLDRVISMAAKNAWAICWLNKDIAAPVLLEMSPIRPEEMRALEG